jgi:hypothetical protein
MYLKVARRSEATTSGSTEILVLVIEFFMIVGPGIHADPCSHGDRHPGSCGRSSAASASVTPRLA